MQLYPNDYPVQPIYSNMEWNGSKSRKFYGGKIHFENPNSFFNGSVITDSNDKKVGIKYIPSKYSNQYQHRSCIKNFQEANQSKSNNKYQGIKVLAFQPLPIKSRPQKSHITRISEPTQIYDLKMGKKTFEVSNKKTEKQYYVQDTMQRKVRGSKLDPKSYYGDMNSNLQNKIRYSILIDRSFQNQNMNESSNIHKISVQDDKLIKNLDLFNPNKK